MCDREDLVVSKRTFWTTALMVIAGAAFPLYAQEPGTGAARIEIIKWSMIAAGFPLGIAAAFAIPAFADRSHCFVRPTRLDALLFLTTLIWGTNYTVIKSAFVEINPQ